MKKYKFETSIIFDELIEEYGIEGISDLDIGEEASRYGIEKYKDLLDWDYDEEEKTLELYVD